MKPVYYLAVDIGASSGRHILASMDNGRMVLEEETILVLCFRISICLTHLL